MLYWTSIPRYSNQKLEGFQDNSNIDHFFHLFFDEIKKFCLEKIKNDDFVNSSQTNQTKKTEGGKPNSLNKNSKQAEVSLTQNEMDPLKNDLKSKIVKRIETVIFKMKEFVSVHLNLFQNNVSKMESLAQNVFKTELDLIKSTSVYISESIEQETKLHYSLQLDKFKLIINKNYLNFIIQKPKPLFDLDKVDWDSAAE